MPHSPRQFTSNQVYELTFRAREGIPLPPKALINLIIQSCIARVQRNFKVHICHMVWMGNHCHILLVIINAEECKLFYKELKNRLTECLKALLGIDRLNLWEKRPNVGRVPDIDSAVSRIAYIYANPARADLTDSIDEYPGVSSFKEFQSIKSVITAESRIDLPWIRAKNIETLHTPNPSERSDAFIAQKLRNSTKKKHSPNYGPKPLDALLWD